MHVHTSNLNTEYSNEKRPNFAKKPQSAILIWLYFELKECSWGLLSIPLYIWVISLKYIF